MLSHPLKVVWLSGNLRSLALSGQTDLPPSGLMQVVLSWILVCFKNSFVSSSSFSHTGNTILICYAVCRGDFPLGSRLRRGQITQSGTWLFFFFFWPHKHIFPNTPIPPTLSSTCFLFSDCLFSRMESKSPPDVNWLWSILRETGAKAVSTLAIWVHCSVLIIHFHSVSTLTVLWLTEIH